MLPNVVLKCRFLCIDTKVKGRNYPRTVNVVLKSRYLSVDEHLEEVDELALVALLLDRLLAVGYESQDLGVHLVAYPAELATQDDGNTLKTVHVQ